MMNFSSKNGLFNLVDSPRLTGGGSPTENRYLTDSNNLQNVEMCSRSPTLVKSLLSRGTCPAELKDKLAIYGTSTKQLVSFKKC